MIRIKIIYGFFIFVLFLSVPMMCVGGGNDEHTKLFLRFDGDFGGSEHLIEIHGNPTLDPRGAKWNTSMHFDGREDYISIPEHIDWDLMGDDFTIDFWIAFDDLKGSQDFVSQREDGEFQWRIYKRLDNLLEFYWKQGGEDLISLSSEELTWNVDEWYHVALTRHENTFTLYRNGIPVATSEKEVVLEAPNDVLKLATFGTGVSATSYFKGRMDEFCFSKGVARWTSDFSDQLHTMPYGKGDGNVTLLLHFDGDIASGAEENHVVNLSKGIDITPDGKWNGSVYINGEGNFVSIPASDDWNFGSNDFTIDFWVRFSLLENGQTAIISRWHRAQNNYRAWVLYLTAGHSLAACSVNADGNYYGNFSSRNTLRANQWYHIAFQRRENRHELYLNGDKIAWIDVAGNAMLDTKKPLYIAENMNEEFYFKGNIDEVRISKGIARWSKNFRNVIMQGPHRAIQKQ